MAEYFVGNKEYFPGIGKIKYEGPKSDNPLAFKYYDPDKKVGGKTMKEHLRFAVAYWHSFCGDGTDMFGAGTQKQPWKQDAKDPMEGAEHKLDAAFEFITKLGAEFYCFHDRDIAPEGATPAESEKNLMTIVAKAKERQKATGVKLLWGTANLFSNPRFMNGAATNPDFAVVSHAAAQVKAAIDATIELGGQGYTFWGGREGYMSLLNTDLKREKEHLGRFLVMARDYARSRGFTGVFYIEPKPMEPSKHQYDFDVETVAGFLKQFGLEKDFRMNIEANHAELAGHDFHHELETAAALGLFGSVDANRGDPRNGWDTDQFPMSYYETSLAMLTILKIGGFTTGGLNFDAHIRRNSVDPSDLFEAHIGGMDAFAVGLEVAHRIIQDGKYAAFVKQRYASFDAGDGARFEKGQMKFEELAGLAKEYGSVGFTSGKQERLENLLNQYLLGL
ncbi:xylose isomerase [Gracilinema caldarium]|uniref:Xylose isomerase n=1 Tax=Gracilinema caldarium (strain ATCC 51460 / DSM 7334 / H1) TaxID=744872 RepID=F8F151_GRAC1|nr:xylose isomerase [Gracilinema caldarium]AEJ20841.1 Xylose isomerase [Gracilinema caldarium DSM 7334]